MINRHAQTSLCQVVRSVRDDPSKLNRRLRHSRTCVSLDRCSNRCFCMFLFDSRVTIEGAFGIVSVSWPPHCLHVLNRNALVDLANFPRHRPQCCEVQYSSTNKQSVSLYLARARVTLRIDGQRTWPFIGELELNSAPESLQIIQIYEFVTIRNLKFFNSYRQ